MSDTDQVRMDYFLRSLSPAQVTRLEQIIRDPDRAAKLAVLAYDLRVERSELRDRL